MCFTPHTSFLFPGQALQQSPDTVVRVGDTATLNCSQKENAFSTLYWYKLPARKDATLQLVVYSVEGGRAEIEKEFRNHFHSNGTKDNRLSVEIDHALLNDSGTYFCAEQDPQWLKSWSSVAQTFPCKQGSAHSTHTALYLTVPHFLLLPSNSVYLRKVAVSSVFCLVSNFLPILAHL